MPRRLRSAGPCWTSAAARCWTSSSRRLSKADIRDILHIQMDDLRRKLSENGITVVFTPAFEDYMVEHGYEPSYGARPIKRLMQRELVNLLAKAILDGTVHRDSAITVDSAGGQILLRSA